MEAIDVKYICLNSSYSFLPPLLQCYVDMCEIAPSLANLKHANYWFSTPTSTYHLLQHHLKLM